MENKWSKAITKVFPLIEYNNTKGSPKKAVRPEKN